MQYVYTLGEYVFEITIKNEMQVFSIVRIVLSWFTESVQKNGLAVQLFVRSIRLQMSLNNLSTIDC